MAEKRLGKTPVLGEETEKDILQRYLYMYEQSLPLVREMLIQKAQWKHYLMYGSMRSVR